MEVIEYRPTQEEKAAARAFASLRLRCKRLLAAHGLGFDKFTVVEHDSYIAHLTERAIADHLSQAFRACVRSVERWDARFDVERIRGIVGGDRERPSPADLQYVRGYFYDHWDLEITGRTRVVRADVKTALTRLEPKRSWNFLYPAVQVGRGAKDLMILVYYVQRSAAAEELSHLVLVGATTPDRIARCRRIRQGERTRFGTVSQIDNFETELARDYRPLGEYLC